MSITLAVPSKGRLKEATLALFGRAGFDIPQPEDARNYKSRLNGMDGVEIAFLPPAEIARELIAGTIDLGVTGEDLAREAIADADRYFDFCQKLGFGAADVVVAVPEAWLDVQTMADLDDVAAEFRRRHGRQLRIATKYWQLTQNFFADHGIAMYRIVESLGATEGAPAAGMADAIVDITSTGSTLRANHLKILEDGIVLRSEANLIASRRRRLAQKERALRDRLNDAVAKGIAR